MKLSSLLREAKDFSKVKKGDIGTTYHGEKVKILHTSNRYDDKMKKFDQSGQGAEASGGQGLVAVQLKGETAVYVYGDDGVFVEG